MAVITRNLKRTITGQAKKYAKQALATLGMAIGSDGVAKVARSTTTQKNKKRKRPYLTRPMIKGTRRNNKKRRCSVIKSANLKGVSRKFKNKVQKVMDEQKNWAKYVSFDSLQLRQLIVDQWAYVVAAESGEGLTYGSPFEILKIASVLFNGATDSPRWSIDTANNFDDRVKIPVQSYDLHLFFKSTSGHVVNIELYECTSKDQDCQTGAHSLVTSSYNNSTFNVVNGNTTGIGSGPFTVNALTREQLGSSAQEWLDLHQQYHVVKHTFKLQPGDYTSLTIPVMRNRTIDLSKFSSSGTPDVAGKGTKSLFFRVINDISVSVGIDPENPRISTGAGLVRAWPSNEIGGVACRITKTVRLTCPRMPDKNAIGNWLDVNVIKRSRWSLVTGADQQVTYQNPLGVVPVDAD